MNATAKNRVVARILINEMAKTANRRITHLLIDEDGEQWELDRSMPTPGYGQSSNATSADGRSGRFERDKGGMAGVVYGIVRPCRDESTPI